MIRELLGGLSISEIARRTGHDRESIRRVRGHPGHPTSQERQKRGSKLDPYKPYLMQRAAAGVLSAVKLLDEVHRQGYAGGITVVRQFVRPFRPALPVVTERFETPPGHQAQVGWTSCGRIWHRLVGRDGYICYRGCRYAVPPEHAGRLLLGKEGTNGRLGFYSGQQCVVEHALAERPGSVITIPGHAEAIRALARARARTAYSRTKVPALPASILPHLSWPEVQARPLAAYDEAVGLVAVGG